MTCIGPSQSCAAATVPWSVPKPIRYARSPNALPAEMADVQLAPDAHLGRRRIAEVRVVLPEDGLGIRAVEAQQRLERLEHVLVAEIPGGAPAIVHDAIVGLGVRDDPRVADRVEEVLAVAGGVVDLARQHVAQHGHHLVLAGAVAAGHDGAPVGRRIAFPRHEAAVALARHARGGGIDAVEVVEHEPDRAVEAVEVEAVEPDAARCVAFHSRSHSTKASTSWLRHIHCGKRAKARHSGTGAPGSPLT